MTTIYLDTNIIINEGFFRFSLSQAFLKACALLNVKVVIPEVVLDEVFANYHRKLGVAAAEFKTKKKKLLALVDLEVEALDVQTASDDFEDWFRELLAEHDVQIVDYPDISAKDLVTKSYTKIKPFKEGGDGHKDYIVWESVTSHMTSKGAKAPFFFVSHNTSDFAEKNKEDSFVLHADLTAQIAEFGFECGYHTSLKGVFDAVLAPSLEHFAQEDIPGFVEQIDTLTDDVLQDELLNRTVYGFEGLSFGNDVTVSHVEDYTVTDRKLYKLGEDVMIEVSGEVSIEVDGFIEKSSYYFDEDGPEFTVTDGNWNDHVMAVSQIIQTPFVVTAVYDVDEKTFGGHTFSLNDEIEDEWPYK